jgi:antitoxin ParD1/3/4
VLREGIRLIEAEEAHWAELDAVLIARADNPDTSDYTPAKKVFDRLEAKYRAMLPVN